MRIYIDVIPYSYKEKLVQEEISIDEPIKNGDEYPIDGHLEIRDQVLDAIKPLASKIRKEEDYIKYSNPSKSPRYIQRGLSAYIDFGVFPPDGLTEQEINQNYKFSLRFSEHPDFHSEGKNRYYIDLQGRKLKDLVDAGWKTFLENKENIQETIRDFEIQKFGEQKTFITDEEDKTENESLRLRIPD